MRTISQEERSASQEQAGVLETNLQWYALQTHSHHEKQVRDRLLSGGIEPFLPLSRQYRQWSDRKVWTTLPLFRGYCFARFSLDNSLAIRKTPGVARIVGIMKPEPIADEEIAVFQQVTSADRPIEPCHYFIEGTWVEVIRGPLTGLRGQFVRRTKHDGLVIRASLIQQAALIHIGADEVVPLG
jgi:transcription termination/antitermination protein NusG